MSLWTRPRWLRGAPVTPKSRSPFDALQAHLTADAVADDNNVDLCARLTGKGDTPILNGGSINERDAITGADVRRCCRSAGENAGDESGVIQSEAHHSGMLRIDSLRLLKQGDQRVIRLDPEGLAYHHGQAPGAKEYRKDRQQNSQGSLSLIRVAYNPTPTRPPAQPLSEAA